MQNKFIIGGISLLLFLGFFRIGITLSELKPLWNDELYTQTYVIDKISYSQILAGQAEEGNRYPLFYLLQKAVCDLTRYHFPMVWSGDWNVAEPVGQIILRMIPNVFMSLALIAIFYFFAREFSFSVGVYAFLVALSAPMVWAYWVEARPYSQWFFLTVMQCLLYLQFLRHPKHRKKTWHGLCLVNLLLSLTVFFGMMQIIVISVLLYLFDEKRPRKYLLMTFLPLLIGFFYYYHTPKWNFNIPQDWSALIFVNFPMEWMLVMAACVIVTIGVFFFSRIRTREVSVPAMRFLLLTGIFLSGVLLIIGILGLDKQRQLFEISSRYFIFLAGIGIIAVSLFSIELLSYARHNRWMIFNVWIGLGGLLLLRLIRTTSEIAASGIY